MALYPGDYRKAKVIRWLTDTSDPSWAYYASWVKQSEKEPLENRVWYAYDGVSPIGYGGLRRGPSSKPTKIGRVLDDGSSQITHTEYNALGNPTRLTDPLGRTTLYVYADNGIDLLEVKQLSGQSVEVLAR